jgi:predicted CopG family antitoxin
MFAIFQYGWISNPELFKSPAATQGMGYHRPNRLGPVVEVQAQCAGLKTISVHEATYYRLRQYVREGKSYEDTLNAMMNVIEGKRTRKSIWLSMIWRCCNIVQVSRHV